MTNAIPASERRASWVLLLAASLLWTGLCTGMAIGAAYFVAESSGLAGPAIAFGYGMLGAAAGAILTGVLAVAASTAVVRLSAKIALVPAILLVGFVAYRFATLPVPVGSGGDGLRPKAPTTAPAAVP